MLQPILYRLSRKHLLGAQKGKQLARQEAGVQCKKYLSQWFDDSCVFVEDKNDTLTIETKGASAKDAAGNTVKLRSQLGGFIKSYTVIRQWQQDGLHQCNIEAFVQIQQLKERLAEANISTFSVSGTNLAARVQTETSAQADTPAILAKLINDLPNRVLRVQAHGDPVPISSKQEGITRLKIPIVVFIDQKAYAQEIAELTTTLDKLALQSVTGNLKLKRQSGQGKEPFGREALRSLSGVQLLPNDRLIARHPSDAVARSVLRRR